MRRFSTIAHRPRTGVTALGAALVIGLSVTAAAPSLHAAPKKEKAAGKDSDAAKKKAAREAYTAGEAAYKAGDYKAAYEGFKKANETLPSIMAEFWTAMAQSYGDDPAAGISSLEAVLMSTDAEKLGEEKLNMADARLKALKTTPATLKITTDPPGATVTLGYKEQPGVTPMTISMAPGTTKVSLSLKGYAPQTIEVTAKAAQKLEQTATLEKAKEEAPLKPPPAEPAAKPEEKKPIEEAPPPAEGSGKKDNLPAYIALGAAGVGVAVGTFFGIQALSAKGDFNDNPTNSAADRVERNALIADMSFGIALALGITGGVLLFTGGDSSSEVSAKYKSYRAPQRARLDVTPMITPHAQGAAARFTF